MDNLDNWHLLPLSHVPSETLKDIASCFALARGPGASASESKWMSNSAEELVSSSQSLCPPHVVQSIYASCVYLELGTDVYHLSVELFELFMNRHVKDIGEQKVAKNLSPECVVATMRNMKQQVWMRLLTCVLLAAKFQQNSWVKVSKIRKKILWMLKRINCRVSEKSLNQSEIRVLKTLEFSLKRPMLLSTLRVVVSSLLHNIPILKGAECFLAYICLLCDLTSLQRRSFHSLSLRKDTTSISTRRRVTSHEDRLVRLTSAIIATAALLSLESELSKKVTEELSFITHLPMEEILAVRDSLRSLIGCKT